MPAARKDLYVEQGATYYKAFTWYPPGPVDEDGLPTDPPHDLTGCSARMQMRRKQGDVAVVNATSAEPVDEAAIALGAGRIRLGGVTGKIEIILTDEDTDLLDFKEGVYDLEVQWPLQPEEIRPHVDRVLQGSVYVDPNVTQIDSEDPVVTE